MVLQQSLTIAAIATATGAAGVAVIRLSGADSWQIIAQLFPNANKLQPRMATFGWIVDPFTPRQHGEAPPRVDEVLILPFKAPHSFTGEDVVEIHCHGGEYLPFRILNLCYQAGGQPAQAGEFTRRAFMNGKLNLAQAEAIADLISAEDEGLVRVATHALQAKGLTQQVASLRNGLTPILANVVAATDYPDEVDEPDRAPLLAQLHALCQQAEALLATSAQNQVWRSGCHVALLGQPNAGKSSLFNALLARERAIVTPQAGTTRDVVSDTLHLTQAGGLALTLLDTAGLRQADDAIEQAGITRSWETCHNAQALLVLVDANTLLDLPTGEYSSDDEAILQALPPHLPKLIVASKTDTLPQGEASLAHRNDVLAVSSVTGVGLPALLNWLVAQQHQGLLANTQATALVALNQRQTLCLQAMVEQVTLAYQTLSQPAYPLDVVTIPLTEALYALQRLTGEDTTEAMLDDVFNRFCVGK